MTHRLRGLYCQIGYRERRESEAGQYVGISGGLSEMKIFSIKLRIVQVIFTLSNVITLLLKT